ncbi:helix-turn-helix domain-containing protein [Clostridium sp. Marseille-P2415]|uniref:helix-turn-helix domain-containing protein n=1 Tax=Clostridium sp. Marseille-P2415 TaxID=1805471 RepID=UPI0009888480|nr:helix-turn-helix transcriptional regulator [Clostridium sp. Marseille-P2415]
MDYIEMGARLRLLRESKTDEMERRFSQRKLVDEFANNGIKMTQSKLLSLENGEASLTPDLIILYSEYFDVSTDFILKGDNETFSSSNELISRDSKYDTTELMEALQ